MSNIQDYMGQMGTGSLGGTTETPLQMRKKFYITVIVGNIALNIFYYAVYFFKIPVISEVLDKIVHTMAPLAPVGIFVILQLFITFISVKQLVQGQKQITKDNIIGTVNIVNLLFFIILLNSIISTYIPSLGSSSVKMSGLGFVFFLVSSAYLVFSFSRVLELAKSIYSSITSETPIEEEQQQTVQIGKYDWVKEYYRYKLSEQKGNPITEAIVGPKWMFYRFFIDQYLTLLIQVVNQTLMIEQKNLISKDIYDLKNPETYVQIDAPKVGSESDMEAQLEKLDFSNEFIQINSSFVALKLNTKYLNKPDHLLKIGDSILPDQKLQIIRDAVFSPRKKLDTSSEDYSQMVSEYKKPYVLFQSIHIEKMGTNWYVVFNFTKWYRRLVIFPQLDTLTTVLEKNEVEKFKGSNPFVWFGVKTTGELIGLTLSRIKHMIFGGESGSGKSVFLNSVIYQLIYRSTPDTLLLVLIDPLRVSFQKLKKLKNLAFPLANDIESTNESINYLISTQKERYQFLESLGYEDIYAYNKDIEKQTINIKDDIGIPVKYRLPGNTKFESSHLQEIDSKIIERKSTVNYKVGNLIPQIMMIYDEFNAFNGMPLYEKNNSVDKLVKLGNEARKAGIILCLGTQKISAETVPSSLRENLATKIAMTVGSKANSRALLGDAPENKGEAASLTGYGDMLVFNKVELDPNYAVRSQGFYVSDDEMNDLVRDSLDTYGMNDFIYQEGSSDEYSWIKDFYSLVPVQYESGNEVTNEIIERNQQQYKKLGVDLSTQLPVIVSKLNSFFVSTRDQLMDKINLDDHKRNIRVDTCKFQTEQEMISEFQGMGYSNGYYTTTKSFIRLKLETSYLSSPEKLEGIEDKMNLQLTDLKKSIIFNPFKPFNEESDDYKNMIKEYEAAYTLIDNFTIVRVKTNFYIQLNYTSAYKKSVVFPQSRTIRAILTESLGHKIEGLLEGQRVLINKG